MIFSVTDNNKYLYHYTSAQTAIDYILKERTLRLNSYISTNDPEERKGWLFDFGTNEGRELGSLVVTIEMTSLGGCRESSRVKR